MNGVTRFGGLLGFVVLLGTACLRALRPELLAASRARIPGAVAFDPTPIVAVGLALVFARLVYLLARADSLLVRLCALVGIVGVICFALGSLMLVTQSTTAA